MEQVVGDDRISGLPEPILHHILSFLLIKDAIKIAPTCKRLNQVWNALPYLDFGDHFFPILPPCEDDDITSNEGIVTKRRELCTFVEQTLVSRRMHDLTIHKFRLGLTQWDVELRRYLDGWITTLVQHSNIKELVLRLCPKEPEWYNLPSVLLSAASLRELTLSHCSMPSCGPIALSSLQKLVLNSVLLSEKILLDIINICRDLEKLSLHHCPGFQKRIFIPGKSHLKTLHLLYMSRDEVDEVIIEAHHLESLSYSAGTRPIKINIITNFGGSLKCLHLCGANITNTWLCELISRLSRLEELMLTRLDLKAIKISSSSLKRLLLCRVRFGEFTIDAPNLVHLTYRGNLKSVFRNSSLPVKEVHIGIDEFMFWSTTWDKQLCRELMQFLNKFDYSEAVLLDCTWFEKMIFPVEMSLILHTPPLAHIKHLALEGTFVSSPTDVLAKLYKGLRWIAPNLDSLTLKRRCERENPFDFIKFTAGECDCPVSPFECSRRCRCLPKFELKGSDDLVSALRDYLVESLKEIHGCDDCDPQRAMISSIPGGGATSPSDPV